MKKITLLLLIISIVSCRNIGNKDVILVGALNTAGKNKKELLNVLHAYNNPSDSLKLEAAIFLIKNLTYKKHFGNSNINKYEVLFELTKPIWQNESLNLEEKKRRFSLLYDSLQIDNTNLNLKRYDDINTLQSEYLINNINQSFYAWQTYPWAKNVSFDDFCNYILPYNVFDEPPALWREPLMERFSWVLDSIKNPESLKEATLWINKSFNKDFTYNSRMQKIPNVLDYNILENAGMGSCTHLVTMNIYCLRAMGIPAKVDYTPQWANYNGSHFWCSINDEKGNLFAFDALYQPKGISDSAYLAGIFDYIPETNLRTRKTAKILRETYRNNMELLPPKHFNKNGIIPTNLIHLNSIDVTSDYKNSSADITLKPMVKKNEEILLLSVFKSINNWGEVATSFISADGTFEFKSMGTDIVYLPIIVNSKNSSRRNLFPFLLTEEGHIAYLDPDTTNLKTVRLDRKYFTDYNLTAALEQTTGGIFQGANYRDFRDAVDLYTITSLPEPKTNHYFFRNNNFRYVRFINPRNRCKVAEMSFRGIDNTTGEESFVQLPGDIISSIPQAKNSGYRIKDGNVLTYFISEDETNGWIGMDLGENHAMVSKVEFYPPNDGNSVLTGDKYELFYWDSKWISLGEQIATDEFLIYKNCPDNALFLLRNLSGGKQERIFLYEQDKQIWY